MKTSKYSFRYNNILEIPQIKSTRYGKKSFRFAAPTLWNSLPDHFRTENSFSQFTQMLQHKAAFKKESAGKNKNKKILLITTVLYIWT
jgi:hypothetical protein